MQEIITQSLFIELCRKGHKNFSDSLIDGNSTNTVFNKCIAEITLFENLKFDNTGFKNSNLSICAFINCNVADIDIDRRLKVKEMIRKSEVNGNNLYQLI